ncbi:Rv2231c family pyridoxal phosphate-dependent protein CobC [Gordonia sp. (in: high G+C Gram-positive bacteria)]|uniref:Rv2231c family pyridoxal phosphate-dependent protein CobC n=1 Tax=Gordonia sp. (in: high G+C Gram-positive bacteria) TaxID=84139 RepID=UPI003C7564AB
MEQRPAADTAGTLFDPHRHGDEDTADGVLDFAVNVRPGPQPFLADALRDRIGDLGAYPSSTDIAAATRAVADLHGREPSNILLLGGAAEGFELLAKLGAGHAALIAPSFTEPERVLRAAGIRITNVVLQEPWGLEGTNIPDDADLVIIGNPTNPTSVLHARTQILALRRPGRIIVVDEAFADLTYDAAGDVVEPESLASDSLPDIIVIRSITKTFALAGLRAGYLLADSSIIGTLDQGRRHWPLGTLSLVALIECLGPQGQDFARREARTVVGDREYLLSRLAEIDVRPAAVPSAPYVLIKVDDALTLKARLRERGIGIRSCANFVGLGPDYLRIAVRPPASTDALIDAMKNL